MYSITSLMNNDRCYIPEIQDDVPQKINSAQILYSFFPLLVLHIYKLSLHKSISLSPKNLNLLKILISYADMNNKTIKKCKKKVKKKILISHL
jgi:hypothetical protein